jgi:hypothetical protein
MIGFHHCPVYGGCATGRSKAGLPSVCPARGRSPRPGALSNKTGTGARLSWPWWPCSCSAVAVSASAHEFEYEECLVLGQNAHFSEAEYEVNAEGFLKVLKPITIKAEGLLNCNFEITSAGNQKLEKLTFENNGIALIMRPKITGITLITSAGCGRGETTMTCEGPLEVTVNGGEGLLHWK